MFLVVDRLPEFRQMAVDAGIQLRPLGNAAAPGEKKVHSGGGTQSSFMQLFFEDVRQINHHIAEVRKSSDGLHDCTGDLLQATTVVQEKRVQDRLEKLVETGSRDLREAKARLEELNNRVGASGSEERVRSNMANALARKLQKEVQSFQGAQSSFSREMKEKTTRQLKIACPEASEADLQRMMDDGETRETVVRRQMAGSHALLLEQLEQVHDKYRAVRKLERSMAELHQLFLDMAQLVEHQGEILDMVEVNVAKTKDATAQAEKELVTARKAQWSSQRRMCCLTVIMLLIVMVVIFPVLFGM